MPRTSSSSNDVASTFLSRLEEAEDLKDATASLLRIYVNSRLVSGLTINQEEIEDYLKNVLRTLYRIDASLFERADIGWLNYEPKERKQIHVGDTQVVRDHYYFQGSEIVSDLPRSDWLMHSEKLSWLLSMLHLFDLRIAPEDIALAITEKSAGLRKELIKKASATWRNERGLPTTTLLDSTMNLRNTYCYNCFKSLSSDLFLQCPECRWIVCTCGACHCGVEGG